MMGPEELQVVVAKMQAVIAILDDKRMAMDVAHVGAPLVATTRSAMSAGLAAIEEFQRVAVWIDEYADYIDVDERGAGDGLIFRRKSRAGTFDSIFELAAAGVAAQNACSPHEYVRMVGRLLQCMKCGKRRRV